MQTAYSPDLQGLGEEGRIHVPAFRGAVDEDGPGTDVPDGIESGGEGEAGDENPVALPDAEQEQGEMESGRPTGKGDAVRPVGDGRQLGLESVDFGPERGDPTAFEGTVDRGLVGQPGVRRGQVDAAHRVIDEANGGSGRESLSPCGHVRQGHVGDGQLVGIAVEEREGA